jgi:hypothetical protein
MKLLILTASIRKKNRNQKAETIAGLGFLIAVICERIGVKCETAVWRNVRIFAVGNW